MLWDAVVDVVSFLSAEQSTDFGGSEFGVLPTPMLPGTWCIPDVPDPASPLPELFHRPQIGRKGLPWCSNSYHTH